jgi:predicted dehydrogenase
VVGVSGRVRLGAVGAGWWATSNHFPILAARDDVDLVGVCSIGPELEAVREQFGFGMATSDYDELLDSITRRRSPPSIAACTCSSRSP